MGIKTLAALAGGAMAAALAMPAGAADVTQTRLENADQEPQNWLTQSSRFSLLNQINRENVGARAARWSMAG